MELDLRTTDDPPSSNDLELETIVHLYSEQLNCELMLEITHLDPEPGGVLRNQPSTPYLNPGDHVHFQRNHVLNLRE